MMQSTVVTIRIGRTATLLTVLMMLVSQALTSGVQAQGTMGTLPDPISSRELDGYARRLGLSPQQRAALDPLHEDYKAQFTALREGDIEKFLTDSNPTTGGRGMGGRGMGMMWANTDRKAVEDSLRRLESINNRIQGLDNGLFDQVQALLTEEQVFALTGVRQARERQRYRTGLARMATFTNPSTQVDLSEMIGSLTLSPDERTNVSPLITSYETSLTSATRKLHDGANSSTLEMLDKLAAMGFNQQAAQDQGRQGEMWQAFRQVWGEIMGKMGERAADISDLNRRTERSIVSVLVPENAHKLRDDFFRRAYPELRGSSNTARAFEVALEFDDLTEEQRNAIAAMHGQYLESVDRLNQQMADAIDAQRKTRNVFDGRGGRGGEDNAAFEKLRDQRRELVDGTRKQVETTLGPELTEKLDKRVAEAREQQREERAVATVVLAPGMGGPGGAVQLQARVSDISSDLLRDPFIPAPITARDLDGYGKRLGLDDPHKDILSGLHADYTDRFKQIDSTDIQAARDADENLWSRDEDGNPKPPTPAAVDQLYDLRRKAIESIKQLDDAFFNDVQMAALTEQQKPLLDRVRQSRLRSVYNRGAGSQGLFGFGGRGGRGGPGGGERGGDRGGRGGPQRMAFMAGPGGGSSEASVDLSILVEDVSPLAADPKQLDATLVEYETSATSAFQSLFETSMRMRQAIDRMSGQFARVERGGDFSASASGMRDVMQTDGKAARDASQTLVNLNRATLDRLGGQLDVGDADQLRRAYNRRAFPDVFRDSRSAEPRLQAALALPDLSDQQREQVTTITGEFRSAYDTLCDQMIELEKSGAQMNLLARVDREAEVRLSRLTSKRLQERMRNREKLEFERNDLNDRMLARLRGALTEDQVQRLGLEATAGSF